MRIDPFETLGVPRRFDLDAEQVQRAWLRAAGAWHPDRFDDPVKRAEAESKSAAINSARETLVDDERRANILLELQGGPTSEQEKSLPDGFLMQMLEVRQEMEEALQSGGEAERARLESWAHRQRDDHVNRVRHLFGDEGERLDESRRREIRQELNAWRYIERMIEQLDPDYSHEGELRRSEEEA